MSSFHHKKYYVYSFTNEINGKVYIGKTDNIDRRFRVHKSANGDCPLFHNAIKKYGISSFKLDVVDSFDTEEQAFNAEKMLIEKLKTNNRDFGYNLTEGGDGMSGHKHTDESKMKMSQALKGKIPANKGKSPNSDTILKMAASHIGLPGYWEGKKLTEETKIKKSNAMKGKSWKVIDGKRVWFSAKVEQ